MKACTDNVKIVPASLGNDAGVIGAAAMFVEI
jgi:predicted NBD/HSP70 family sugar kinase